MRSGCQQVLSVFLGVLLFLLPVFGHPADLIGVAKATGPAEINGLIFPGETNLYSGDRVRTGPETSLTVFVSPQERIHVAPRSRARFLRDGEATVIALEEGMVAFRTEGHTRLVLEQSGVSVRGQSDFPGVAQVTLMNGRGLQVRALGAPIEIEGVGQSVLLQPGELASISHTPTQAPILPTSEGSFSPQAQQSTEAQPGSVKGRAVDNTQAPVWRATVLLTSRDGVTHTTETNQLGQFSFEGLAPGFYSLSITKKGLHRYQTGNVLVEPGRQSSLGVITLQRGMGGGKKAAITIVVISGVAAGVGIPLLVGDGQGPQPASPSVP